MTKDDIQPGFEVSVSAEGASVRASDGTVKRVTGALARLFSRSLAKARIEEAMGERIATKIEQGDYSFSPQEQAFIALIFRRDFKRLVNQQEILGRAGNLLPQFTNPGGEQAPPPDAPRESAPDWADRFLSYAADVSDESMRDLYARICAGEAARPGSFSLNTLTVLRRLDPETIVAFRRVRSLVFEDWCLVPLEHAQNFYASRELSYGTFLHLEAIGLLTLREGEVVFRPTEPETTQAFVCYGSKRLRVSASSPEKLCASVWSLTRSGRELAALEPLHEDGEFLQVLAQHLSARRFGSMQTMLAGGLKTEWSPDGITWRPLPESTMSDTNS